MQYIKFLGIIHPCALPRRLLAFKDFQVQRLKALSFIFHGLIDFGVGCAFPWDCGNACPPNCNPWICDRGHVCVRAEENLQIPEVSLSRNPNLGGSGHLRNHSRPVAALASLLALASLTPCGFAAGRGLIETASSVPLCWMLLKLLAGGVWFRVWLRHLWEVVVLVLMVAQIDDAARNRRWCGSELPKTEQVCGGVACGGEVVVIWVVGAEFRRDLGSGGLGSGRRNYGGAVTVAEWRWDGWWSGCGGYILGQAGPANP
ncbi:uncharacterized protein LOC133734824 isoform X2 [Rosa rugosa]|uniref:uncharacterized protein LOC133734824 isoform X2 n=1 Tax=Rosa rugosa TaxID=74645 RepID=UPI002B40C864|nr:uncharacterized protein LOC133734824 isoform X2 [Rosa rugosa]